MSNKLRFKQSLLLLHSCYLFKFFLINTTSGIIVADALKESLSQTPSGPSTTVEKQLTFSPSSPVSNVHNTGPIDDATCNVEQLEEANDSQLFTILEDLIDTVFFRNFSVDLDAKCPLSWNNVHPKKETVGMEKRSSQDNSSSTTTIAAHDHGDDSSSSSSFGSSGGNLGQSFVSPFDFGPNDNEEGGCASEGLPDADPDSEPACHVDLGDGDTNTLPIFDLSATNTAISPSSHTKSSKLKDIPTNDSGSDTSTSSNDESECTGGSMTDEVDDDAPPLCEVAGSSSQEETSYFDPGSGGYTTISNTPLQDLLSSALNSINDKLGSLGNNWESDSEKKTFLWESTTDPVVLSTSNNDESCSSNSNIDPDLVMKEGRLPDTFWLDMCSQIQEGDGIKMVDLILNPERNTGYNGTHIWRAIYEENCIDMDGLTDEPMCYEERVLYRMLSGLHASTTLSIAKNYYPPSKKRGRVSWESNPTYFYEKFSSHPEYIRNLHFSYVVLLRALKKAQPILSQYEIRTGNIVDDETAMVLLKRLLDSSILKSCTDVFTAFDESLMFQSTASLLTNIKDDESNILEERELKFPTTATTIHQKEVVTLQQNFKGVFHNISSILDCVQCQQCKLHGKMAMLGYGTALKILFMTNEEVIASSLTRNEIVALINTVAKFSEAMKEIRELTHLYWATTIHESAPIERVLNNSSNIDPFDSTIGAISALTKSGSIGKGREEELIMLALNGDSRLLSFGKHYGNNLDKFLHFTAQLESGISIEPDAIVVGTGLAGLTATLNILDRGGRVVLVEKEHNVGGNSNKASSGINACRNDTMAQAPSVSSTSSQSVSIVPSEDYLESFIGDTIKSAGLAARPDLIDTLVKNSWSAVTWLKERVGVDLSLVAQLGGHRYKRTHRPKNGMVGAEIIYGMQKAVREYEKTGQVKILTDTKVLNLIISNEGNVTGVQVEYLTDGNEDQPNELKAANVILATGGFAADRSDDSLLSQYRPELLEMPATAGPYSTGDGVALATAAGAGLVDMDKVQIHPTGWIDPQDPSNPNKILAGELMRGVGGILLNDQGKRFCNELGTRSYVTDKMLHHDSYYAKHKTWKKDNELQSFALILSSTAASEGKKHVDHYVHKGLMSRLEGVGALAKWMKQDVNILKRTLSQYIVDAGKGFDEWGKKAFQGLPDEDFENEIFYAGMVTPVLHYCMGGITIDKEGNVLNEDRQPIRGLHAAGEVTGGVHGNNRLGGNSLLECTVYGTIVGKKIPVSKTPIDFYHSEGEKVQVERILPEISSMELRKHNTEDDCWVAIHGHVYDLSDFAESHPPGAESIYKLGGTDGTEAFQSIHNQGMLDDFEEDLLGVFRPDL